MATETYKVLGQVDSATAGANTDGDLYTVPGATSTVVSSIVITNRSTAATFIIKVRVAGAASNVKQQLYSGLTINANDTIVLTAGITLAATDVLTVQASTTSVTFQAFGVEIT